MIARVINFVEGITRGKLIDRKGSISTTLLPLFPYSETKDIHHRIASQRASLIRIFRSIDGINTVIHGDISLRIDRYDIIGSNSFSRYEGGI